MLIPNHKRISMKTFLKILLFVAAVMLSGIAVSGELEKAGELYEQGKYQEALVIYQKPKYQNNATAQLQLGNIYLKPGFRNDKKSTAWFKKAADQDDPRGMVNLGLAYQKAVGVKQDYAKALKLFKQAAEKNHASAMTAVGYMYDNGLGVKADEKEAANWYLKAANAGNPNGMCNMAGMMMNSDVIVTDYKQAHYLLNMCLQYQLDNDCCLNLMSEMFAAGWHVKQDFKKAHELRAKAASQDNPVAMYMLGRDYDYGIGTEKDPKAAMDWYLKAAEKKHAKAMYRLYEVYEHGKLGQSVDKAQAQAWKARAEKAMKEQDISRNAWIDDFRLKMEDEQ